MNFYVMDAAGRFLTYRGLFETYDHNYALKLNWSQACQVRCRFRNCTIEAI